LLIIGEKINGTRKEVAAAIAARDADKIRDLARTQVEAGANYLDINAGTSPALEPEAMSWLVRTVQQEVDTPLSIDTPNPVALAAALAEVKQTPLVNSISGERERLERILPLAAEHGCPLIMLALDDTGMPKTVDDRMRVIGQLLERTDDAGIPQDKLFIDPLIMAISTGDEQGNVALETMRRVREQIPDAHITGGLSNISFGMPIRSLINRAFVVLAIAAGMDSAIMDPTNRDMIGMILAAEALVGKDRFCRSYNRAFRDGRIGPGAAA
jgi:5-methyltetrahydrofolate corrinoid/iron sulfur protein methyltransferase